MAEAQTSGLLKQLASVAARELELESRLVLFGVQEVRKLESGLRTILPVLEDAERRQFTEEAVKLWLEKLKDLSYELDDVLDEWNTEMIRSEIEKEQPEIPHRYQKKVCSIFFTSCCFRRVHRLATRHDIAYKIKILNGMVDEIARLREGYGFTLVRDGVVERPRTFSFSDFNNIVGRDSYKDGLVSLLLDYCSQEEMNPYVIALVGEGGIGKTTLAQLAYNDRRLSGHFDLQIWIYVSAPFDLIQIANEIIQSAGGHYPSTTVLEELLHRMCDLIGRKKFFIVLDDLWIEDRNLWEPLRIALRYGAQGSKILVTTRKHGVAEMMASASIINVGLISDDDCWMLFKNIAFYDKDPEQVMQFVDLGRNLVSKCRGLPLAVKILGGLMRFKNSRTAWKQILNSNFWALEDLGSCIFAPLLLSYMELPSAMKRCFSYCAVFPKDSLPTRDELVRLWMAQGYLDSKANMEMERIGEEYFENLALRCFFDGSRISYPIMHGLVHDFAQFLMKNECFTILVDDDKELGAEFLGKSTRHLSLRFENQTQFLPPVYGAKTLRSLLAFGTGCSNNVLRDLFQHFPCVRALTLSFTSIQELPYEVEKLKHLRFLNLSHNNDMKRLPETICNLCNLQSLDVTLCRCLEKLPWGIGKLVNLRHLILEDTDLITSLPRGIGRLTSLRRLDNFVVVGANDSQGCKLGELRNLNFLEGGLTIKGLGKAVDLSEAQNAQLKNKIHLCSLCLEFIREDEGDEIARVDELVLNALEPNPHLESLKICGFQGMEFPNWISNFFGLKTLVLIGFSKVEHLPPLGKLPFLESLWIRYVSNVRRVRVEFLGVESIDTEHDGIMSSCVLFPNLKYLEFMSMSKWEEWHGIGRLSEEEHVTIMPRLQDLKILYCPRLEALPDFLYSISLKELMIDGAPILSQRCQRETGEDWAKISHIPIIIVDQVQL